jgi:hypothetical protein
MKEPATEDSKRSRLWLLAVPAIYTLAGPSIFGLVIVGWLAIGSIAAKLMSIETGSSVSFVSVATTLLLRMYADDLWIYLLTGLAFVVTAFAIGRADLSIAVVVNSVAPPSAVLANLFSKTVPNDADIPHLLSASVTTSVMCFISTMTLWALWRCWPRWTLLGSILGATTLAGVAWYREELWFLFFLLDEHGRPGA